MKQTQTTSPTEITKQAIAAQLGYERAPMLLTQEEVAEVLGVSKGSLEVWRSTGKHGIPFVKVGRLVRYRIDAIAAYVEQQTQAGTEVQA